MKTYEACLGKETMKGVAFLPILKQEEENYKFLAGKFTNPLGFVETGIDLSL